LVSDRQNMRWSRLKMTEENRKEKIWEINADSDGTSRMPFQYKNDRWKRVRLVTYFRLLVWWGAATKRQIRMQHFKLLPVIERVNQPVDMPVSDWIIDHDQCFCLTGPHHQHDYQIVLFHPCSWQ
jgi:hypothetical protein